MVRHGGCLGLGLAAMGTHRQDAYEQLKYNLYQDDAVTGEAAGIAMGMVMLGSQAAHAIEDMVGVSVIVSIAWKPNQLKFKFFL
jgi:26S proteasome regulatory subunit N2